NEPLENPLCEKFSLRHPNKKRLSRIFETASQLFAMKRLSRVQFVFDDKNILCHQTKHFLSHFIRLVLFVKLIVAKTSHNIQVLLFVEKFPILHVLTAQQLKIRIFNRMDILVKKTYRSEERRV